MCGIVGIFQRSGQGPQEPLLRRMIEPVRYRGPDECDVHVDGPIGLGHCRLSIIDLATGQQPMLYHEGSLAITFNGEIFNHVELRRDLEAKGRRFRTRSDTEVILQLYDEYGEDCVQHLNGQWAFAVWDGREGGLFLSRDRVGICPLHYVWAGGDFLFASEIKSLLEHPAVSKDIDLKSLDDIFTLWTPTLGRTFFRDIKELPPGHAMRIDSSGEKKWAYWRIDYPEVENPRGVTESAEELRELLKDSVRLRLRSDVPVGAYLSGGLDSSLTVAMIRKYTQTPLRTFSVTFEDQEYDESVYQDAVVRHLDTDHTRIHCTGEEIGRIFPRIVWHTEKPIIRTAPAPLFLLSGLVRESGFKVVLTGEGADEFFGGYDIFKEAKIRRFWGVSPDSKWRPLLLRRLYPYMPALQSQSTDYLKAFFRVREQDLADPFFSHLPRWELTSGLKGFFSGHVKSELKGRKVRDEVLAELPESFARWPSFCQAQYLETAYLLPGYILSSQGDRMSMANAVEGRFPFLDCRVVDFASRLDPRLKMHGLREKFILKQVAGDLVPPEVIRRPKQPYRAPDVPSFFFGDRSRAHLEYVGDMLSEDRVAQYGLFEPKAVSALVRKCGGGGRMSVKDSMALVGILSTQLVVHQFTRGFGRI